MFFFGVCVFVSYEYVSNSPSEVNCVLCAGFGVSSSRSLYARVSSLLEDSLFHCQFFFWGALVDS